jgi:surface polysaccharide O-acyltransferase-like enzyme
MGLAGFMIALVAGVFLFPLAFSGHLFSLELTEALANFTGNGQWQSAVYALWDSTFAVGIYLGAITLFRRFLDGQGRFGKYLSQHSYTVYVIHIPIVVFLGVALKGIELENLLKFGIAAVIAVPTCFAIAYIVRKIPLASRIL